MELRGRFAQKRISNLHISWRLKKWKDQNGICPLCRKVIREDANKFMRLSLDHKIPLIARGVDHWENVQATHYRCNVKKDCLMPGIQDYAFYFRKDLESGEDIKILVQQATRYIKALKKIDHSFEERDRAIDQMNKFIDEHKTILIDREPENELI